MNKFQKIRLMALLLFLFQSVLTWGYTKEMLSKLELGTRVQENGTIALEYRDGRKVLISTEQIEIRHESKIKNDVAFDADPTESNFRKLTEERKISLAVEYLRDRLTPGQFGQEKSTSLKFFAKSYFDKLADEDKSEVAFEALTKTRVHCDELGLPSESENARCNKKAEEKVSELLSKIQRWNPKDLERAACVIAGSLVGWDPYKAFGNSFDEWRDMEKLRQVQYLIKLAETNPEFGRVKHAKCDDNPPFQIWDKISAAQSLLTRLNDKSKNYSVPEPKFLESYALCAPEVAAAEIIKIVESVKTFKTSPLYINVNKPNCAFTLYIKMVSNDKFKIELRNALYMKPVKTAEFTRAEDMLKQLYGNDIVKLPAVQKILGLSPAVKASESKTSSSPQRVK